MIEKEKRYLEALLLARRSLVIMEYGQGKKLIGNAYDEVKMIDSLLKDLVIE